VKMDAKQVAEANSGKFAPLPEATEVVPTARNERVSWRYTLQPPELDWFKPDYDASGWNEGVGGFGTRGTPGAVVRTAWSTSDIWLRREFSLPGLLRANLRLIMHHAEDAEVYVNGVLAARVTGYTTDYEQFELSTEAMASIRPTGNVLAIHCRQTGGGQFIDAGIVRPLFPGKK